MARMRLKLELMPDEYAVARLAAGSDIPEWAESSPFYSVTRTAHEVSIVSMEKIVPATVKVERGWRCLKVKGNLDFMLTGVLAAVALPLAQAEISLFAVSTYDTDYLLVKSVTLEKAIMALSENGHTVE